MLDERATIVVTGAGSGIGRQIALQAAKTAGHVALLDVDEAGARATRDRIDAAGHASASTHEVDVSDATAIDAAIAAVADHTGRIDGLVNAAAVLIEGATTELSETDLDRALDVNLKGPWRMIRAAAPHLAAGPNGAIVNIASIEGLAAAPNHLAYAVSKAGLIALTRTVAVDLGPTVRCNTICPGTILTPMSEGFLDRLDDPAAARQLLADKTLVGRLGQPDDIASATMFLLAPHSAFINATVLVADGGRMSRVP